MGAFIPAVEERLKANIMMGSGFDIVNPRPRPEVNETNYLPRVNIPTLMLNGRYDTLCNFERSIKPMFDLLGTPREHKALKLYETDHIPPKNEFVKEILAWLERGRPQQIYAAGDLSDPHGTHRVCLDAILTAMRQLRREAGAGRAEAEWSCSCEVWLYRGAWQEWEPHEIEMAVPLSPDEVERKRMAIFFHESQKDKALFPGPWDTREFWKRAEDRNANTARIYDELGLPEYQAIEAFVRWQPDAQSQGADRSAVKSPGNRE